MKTKISLLLHTLLCVLCLASCDKFLDITPTGKVIPATGEEFRSLMTNAYNSLPSDRGLTCLRSDEVQMPTGADYATSIDAYLNIWSWQDDLADDVTTSFSWRMFYQVLYIANYIIEHQGEITDIKAAERSQLVGEAYMLRAYMHFTLANLFAEPYTHCDPANTRGIPLKLNSDVNEVLRNSRLDKVYEQILADIAEAAVLMNVEKWGEGETYRFNRLSAWCLYSRVFLYMGNYADALTNAKVVIKEHPALEELSGNVLPNHYQSVEAIASTEMVITAQYKSSFWVNRDFVSLYRTGDYRKSKFFKAETASKYTLLKAGSGTGSSTTQSVNAFRCTFRSAEFYLTAAECALRTGDRAAALDYFLQLAAKRYNTSVFDKYKAEWEAMTDEALLDEILNERARELAFEGHRWFDLRRTTRPALTKTYRNVTYTLDAKDKRYTLKIPTEAIAANPGLAE
ncbi:MAG: RagB/SusD family nutrient uptake outer membrane protein [Bacteroidaceae bacterium]|nr:RagB/SusD family nutrient uptake outer membrane protein [Bacteroidaceae bacterium]